MRCRYNDYPSICSARNAFQTVFFMEWDNI